MRVQEEGGGMWGEGLRDKNRSGRRGEVTGENKSKLLQSVQVHFIRRSPDCGYANSRATSQQQPYANSSHCYASSSRSH